MTTRGVERRRVFVDRADGREFLTQLWQALDKVELQALALCLMPNHYHLVVAGARDGLSHALHRVNGLYAMTFNAKYDRSGHLWGDRYALRQIRGDAHLRAACLYVVANPVRARLCATPREWPWSWSRFGRTG